MDHLECPSPEAWNARRDWFEQIEQGYESAGYLVSEQACALTADVQAVFCAGAWASVIILAMAVVDAQLRETELPGFRGTTKALLNKANANPKLDQLRRKRNALIHVDPDNPALTVDQQWFERSQLESQAREAVTLMFEAFFMSPWT